MDRSPELSPTTCVADRIMIDDTEISQAREVAANHRRKPQLLLDSGDGALVALPAPLQRMLFHTLKAVGNNGQATISRMPEVMSSTTAAQYLGVSRPTLIQWAKQGKLASHMVGKHHRFATPDVVALAKKQARERAEAFERLRELEREMGIEE